MNLIEETSVARHFRDAGILPLNEGDTLGRTLVHDQGAAADGFVALMRELDPVLAEQERQPIPWYFKAMLVASIIYLGYRGYQGVTWIAAHV